MTRHAVPELSHAVNHICVNERICYVHAAKCSAGMASCLASVSSKIWQETHLHTGQVSYPQRKLQAFPIHKVPQKVNLEPESR